MASDQTDRQKTVLISSESSGRHINVLIAGEINSRTSTKVENELCSIMDGGCRNLFVSLENVSLVTSAGLRMFLLVARLVENNRGLMVLYDVSSSVFDVFRMTGFDGIIPIVDSYESAVSRAES